MDVEAHRMALTSLEVVLRRMRKDYAVALESITTMKREIDVIERATQALRAQVRQMKRTP